MKMTIKDFKSEVGKTIYYFISRDEYKKNLSGWIKKYGLANLPASVQRTVPTDIKVLYEIKWWLQPIVWFKIIQIAWHNAQNESIGRVVNG